ncbi:Alpha/beta hydrolase family protein [compost metagenome]
MPFNLAVFNSGAADEVYNKLPGIKNWYIGGHSLGGAMASSYASKHQDKVKGLILLGAYVYGGISPDDALTIYGSNDHVMDQTKVDYTPNVHVINGGNHAQFGNYGLQKGDGTATITREQQQDETAGLILDFIKSKNGQ